MAVTKIVTERSYCGYCGGWMEKGEVHDLSNHPRTIHGDYPRD